MVWEHTSAHVTYRPSMSSIWKRWASTSDRYEFKRKLIRARLNRGWSRAQLADMVGVGEQSVRKWEDFHDATAPKNVTGLEHVLGLEYNDLFQHFGYRLNEFGIQRELNRHLATKVYKASVSSNYESLQAARLDEYEMTKVQEEARKRVVRLRTVPVVRTEEQTKEYWQQRALEAERKLEEVNGTNK